MNKIYYDSNGWVCERYPYDIPKSDNYIEVDDDVLQQTMSAPSHFSWKVLNGKLELHRYELTPENELLDQERSEIESWFISTDYMPNKIITGEWLTSDPRWIQYLKDRKTKRDRLDQINKEK